MNNVLIIGNDFDRQLGLKTDFISFLDWGEDKTVIYDNSVDQKSARVDLVLKNIL